MSLDSSVPSRSFVAAAGRWAALALPSLIAVTPLSAQAPVPAAEAEAAARLDGSPRHGEWIRYEATPGDSVDAWVVYPERSDPAPVVVVIHEIYGLTDWIRGVADQFAAEGFVAIAPDLLSGKGPNGGGTGSMDRQGVVREIRGLDTAEVDSRLRAAANWATSLPSTTDRVGTVGFCWGGSTSFRFATSWPELDAAVVYYGSSPSAEALAALRVPVLGLYGENDERVNSTIEPARTVLQPMQARYEVEIYDGAGHGFLRQQDGQEGANGAATEAAWPRTVAFFRELLGR